jgi:hypothetical protein
MSLDRRALECEAMSDHSLADRQGTVDRAEAVDTLP